MPIDTSLSFIFSVATFFEQTSDQKQSNSVMVEQNLSKIPTQGSMQSAPKAGVLVVVEGLPPLLQGYSEAELKALEQKLLRKIDIRLLPILILIYVMNYLDR